MRRSDPARVVVSVVAEQIHSWMRVSPSIAWTLVGCLSVLLAGRAARAGVGVGVAPTYPSLIVVGDTTVPVGLSIVNTSTSPESGGMLTLTLIKHTPSCGTDSPVPCPAGSSDPGVFLVKGPATGQAGTACAGTTFTIGPPDPTTGEVEFIPSSPVVLAPVGAGDMATCTINFFVDVLMSPTKDSSGAAGIQTNQLGRVRATASVNNVTGTGTGSGVTTLIEPTPTPTATPTNTPTQTPTATLQTISPTPTKTPGPSDCCECSDPLNTCTQPSAGQCGLICPNGTPPAIIPHAVCVVPPPTTTGTPSTPAAGGCASPTPTPSPTTTSTPMCLGPDPGGIPDLIPGYCGPMKLDCLSEICMSPPQPRRPDGLPDNHPDCKVDDPTCDAVLGDKACTFTFRLCFNLINLDKRFFCTAQGPVTAARLRLPPEGSPRTAPDGENVNAFETALMKLGGIVTTGKKRSIVFNPPLVDPICTDPIHFKIPLRQTSGVFSARTFRANWWIYQAAGHFDGDHLYFRCEP